MLSWMRKQAGSPWVKALMVLVAVTFFGGFGLLSSTRVQSCLGVEDQARQGDVLAIVDQSEITEPEFRFRYTQRYNALTSQLRSQFPDQPVPDYLIDRDQLRKDVMEEMVREELVLKQAELMGIAVSRKEVQDEISKAWGGGKGGVFDKNRYSNILKIQGLSEAGYEELVRKDIRRMKTLDFIGRGAQVLPLELKERYAFDHEKIRLEFMALDPATVAADVLPGATEVADYYQQHEIEYYLGQTRRVEYVSWRVDELENKITVSSDEIKQYFEEAKPRYLQEPEQVSAQHILIRVDRQAPENDIMAARAKIDEVYKKATAPDADFTKLAKQFSEGPTGPEGGNLGWFTRQDYARDYNMPAMVTEFEQAAFALEPGQVSEPFQTDFGWHILKVNDKKPNSYIPLEEVKEEIKKTIKTGKTLDLARSRAEELKGKVDEGKTFEEAAKEAGREIKTSDWFQDSDQEIFRMSDSKAIIQGVFKLGKGQLSEPLVGQEHVYLARVIEIKDERQGSLDEVRERIEEVLKPEAQARAAFQIAETYLQKLKDDEIGIKQAASELDTELQQTEMMERADVSLPELGFSDTLEIEAAGMDEENHWPQKPFVIAEKPVIIHFLDSEPPDMSAFEKDKESYRTSLISYKRNELIEAWIEKLKEGKVEYTERWSQISP